MLLDDALPAAEVHGGLLLTRVLARLSWSEFIRGHADEAEASAERSLAIAQQLRHPIAIHSAMNMLAAASGFAR